MILRQETGEEVTEEAVLVEAVVAPRSRITSYNVCYTKLLRDLQHFSGQLLAGLEGGGFEQALLEKGGKIFVVGILVGHKGAF